MVLDATTTTIKTDGKESDPYLFLAPLTFKELKGNDYFKYIQSLDAELQNHLNKISHKNNLMLLSERLINMPIQVVPATFKIVLEEVEKNNDGKHYDNYLIPSRKYQINEESEDNSNKRVKTVDLDYYHYEDKFFEDNADFRFQTEPRGGLVYTFTVISHDGLVKAISQLEDAIAQAYS